MRRIRSIGEASICTNHPTKNLYISLNSAKKLAVLVAQEKNWPVYSIIYTGRVTKRTMARVWPKQRRMIVNVNGERVCTILHELAHHVGRGHDWTFKNMHLNLLNLWETKWSHLFKSETHSIDMSLKNKTKSYHFSQDDEITENNHEVKKLSKSEIDKLIEEAITELVDEIDNSIVTPFILGKKLLEFKVNNLESMIKAKKLLLEYGISVKNIII